MPIKGDGRILEMPQISVLIIDEDNLSRKGLRKMLNDLNWFTEIAEIGTYQNIEETYNIVIVCNDFNSAELIKEIRGKDAHQKIIVLLLHLEELVIAKLIEHEVNGIVLKTSPFEELIKSIQLVAEGRDFFSQEISTMFYHLWASKKSLKGHTEINFSKRETEVLVAICNQKTNDEIADELFLSPSSVKKYRCSLLEKTKSKTSAGLILYAVKNGIYKV
jgi:DNA-binding NarL/FixJ family response regulator